MIETLLYIAGFLVILLVGYLLRNKHNLFFILQLSLIALTGFLIYRENIERDNKADILQSKINALESKQKAEIPKNEEGNIEIKETIEINNGVEKREITTIKDGVKTINKTEKKISAFGE